MSAQRPKSYAVVLVLVLVSLIWNGFNTYQRNRLESTLAFAESFRLATEIRATEFARGVHRTNSIEDTGYIFGGLHDAKPIDSPPDLEQARVFQRQATESLKAGNWGQSIEDAYKGYVYARAAYVATTSLK